MEGGKSYVDLGTAVSVCSPYPGLYITVAVVINTVRFELGSSHTDALQQPTVGYIQSLCFYVYIVVFALQTMVLVEVIRLYRTYCRRHRQPSQS